MDLRSLIAGNSGVMTRLDDRTNKVGDPRIPNRISRQQASSSPTSPPDADCSRSVAVTMLRFNPKRYFPSLTLEVLLQLHPLPTHPYRLARIGQRRGQKRVNSVEGGIVR